MQDRVYSCKTCMNSRKETIKLSLSFAYAVDNYRNTSKNLLLFDMHPSRPPQVTSQTNSSGSAHSNSIGLFSCSDEICTYLLIKQSSACDPFLFSS